MKRPVPPAADTTAQSFNFIARTRKTICRLEGARDANASHGLRKRGRSQEDMQEPRGPLPPRPCPMPRSRMRPLTMASSHALPPVPLFTSPYTRTIGYRVSCHVTLCLCLVSCVLFRTKKPAPGRLCVVSSSYAIPHALHQATPRLRRCTRHAGRA